jgi:predicted nucleotidyltransferase
VTSAALDRDSLATRLRELLEPRPEILEAYLFGSVTRGDAQAHSDIDIAVVVDESIAREGGFGYRASLTADLMSGLETNAVDLVVLNQAPPLLYHRVLRDGVRLFSRDLMATTTREARALSRYFDFIPQLEKIDAGFREAAPSKVAEP